MKLPSLLSGHLAGFNLNQTSNPQNKRLQAMQDSIRQLSNLPSPQQTAKQMAKEKIGQLRQRLEQLRAQLLYASPAQAKALAKELKEIASQLASVAKGMSSDSSNSVSPSVASADTQASSEAATNSSDTPPPPVKTDAETSTSAEAVASKEATATDNTTQTDPTRQPGQTDGKRADTDNNDLKKLLIDAKKLLKQVAEQLKAKLANDPEAKKDLEAVQKRLAEIDNTLQEDSASLTYSNLGELDVSTDQPDLSGASVDTSA